ncbi:MAG TPA: MBL fold metallo-hydrolase [Candidatus Polarisedimenticolaceae bacterium]|nr:MBL fold metallo-hydrolase [Candidatus Polarisedimenticolaceae bacterium]
MQPPRLTFLGAVGTVTGSRFLVEHGGLRLLVDCGLFQGLKELRQRNWEPPPFDPAELDCVVLTHAHLDHSGYLPVLVRRGFRGPILATDASCDLCRILLPDSGHIQEEDARFANRRGFSRHQPALPLYTEVEARHTLEQLRPIPFDTPFPLGEGAEVRLQRAGHILGAASAVLRLGAGASTRTLVASGDLGRPEQRIVPDPAPLPACDHLLLESTYGNRDHPVEDPKARLEAIVRETARRGGVVLIPAFAVGRTQELLYLFHELELEDRLPRDVPIYVDSPMAIHAIQSVLDHPEAQDREMRAQVARHADPLGLRRVHQCSSVEESKALNQLRYPAIIISASGMATGGRVLHHLAFRLEDHRNTVLLVGFQAAGTRGRALRDGATRLRLHGRDVAVRASVQTIDGLSAHADRGELLRWLQSGPRPGAVHLVHGEPEASAALAERIQDEIGLTAHLPRYRETIEL